MSDRFAHQLRIDQIGDGERLDLTADAGERSDIARRLGLQRIERFDAHVTLSRTGEVVRCEGRFIACLEQSCVVTGEPIATSLDEPFELVFMPEPQSSHSDEEIELGEADCDVVFHDGATIDLGSAIADTLALSLDPYPRSAAADVALKEAGIISEAEAGPFAALAKLRKKDEP